LKHVLIAAVTVLMLGTATAEARPGSGFSFGSRGSRTFSVPAPTRTAPRPAAPIGRSMTQPGPVGAPLTSPSRFGGFGRGLFMGLLGGGLIGLLTGGGMGSIFALILQIGLIVLLIRLAMGFFARRASFVGSGAGQAGSGLGVMGGSSGSPGPGAAASSAPLAVSPSDYTDFERLLGEIQAAFGLEDVQRLRRAATPEMASHFEEELSANAARGLVNRISGAKLLQGDLSEAWREGDADYASVAMRYAILDMMVERASGRIVAGDAARPQEVTELWTFRRPRAGSWQLSAIQQV